MTGMPKPVAETNVVGRHGRVGVDVLPRELEIVPKYDRNFVEQGMAIVAVSEMTQLDSSELTGVVPKVEKPVEEPGFYL